MKTRLHQLFNYSAEIPTLMTAKILSSLSHVQDPYKTTKSLKRSWRAPKHDECEYLKNLSRDDLIAIKKAMDKIYKKIMLKLFNELKSRYMSNDIQGSEINKRTLNHLRNIVVKRRDEFSETLSDLRDKVQPSAQAERLGIVANSMNGMLGGLMSGATTAAKTAISMASPAGGLASSAFRGGAKRSNKRRNQNRNQKKNQRKRTQKH